MFRVRGFVVLVLVFVLALTVSFVGAQSTPVPLTTTSIFAGANDLIATYGLAALISVAAFIGVMFMLIRRAKRAAM